MATNEIYEFILKLSVANYQESLRLAKAANTSFSKHSKLRLDEVAGYYNNLGTVLTRFREKHNTNLRQASQASTSFAVNIERSTARVASAYEGIGTRVEKALGNIMEKMHSYERAMVNLNTTAAGELRGLSAKMLGAANDTTEYTNALKSLNATARSTALSLGKLNQAQGGGGGVVIPGAAPLQSTGIGFGGTTMAPPAGLSGQFIAQPIPPAVGQSIQQTTQHTQQLGQTAIQTTKDIQHMQERLGQVASASRTWAATTTAALGTVGAAVYMAGNSFGEIEASLYKMKGLNLDKFKEDTKSATRDLMRFKEAALDLGQTTQFTTQSIGRAGVELAKMGYSTAESLKALPAIIHVATLEEIELAEASRIVTTTLKGFGKSAEEATHFADVLGRASARSAISFSDLGETFKYVSGIARASSQDIETMAGLVTIMGDAGIKASQAGTSLRQGLIALQRPTKSSRETFEALGVDPKDQNTGKLKDLAQLMKELQKAMMGLDETTKNAATSAIFGQYALSGMISILNSSPEQIDGAVEAMKRTDITIKEMAETSFQGLNAEFTKFLATVESAKIALGEEMAPELTKMIHELKGMAYWIGHMPQETRQMIGTILIWISKLSLLGLGVSSVTLGISMMAKSVVALIGVNNASAIALAAKKIAVDLAAASIIRYNTAVMGATTNTAMLGRAATMATAPLTGMGWAIGGAVLKFAALATAVWTVVEAFKAYQASFEELNAAHLIDEEVTKQVESQSDQLTAMTKMMQINKGNPRELRQMLIDKKITPQQLKDAAAGARLKAKELGQTGNRYLTEEQKQGIKTQQTAYNAIGQAWFDLAQEAQQATPKMKALSDQFERYHELQNEIAAKPDPFRFKKASEEMEALTKTINSNVADLQKNGFKDVKTLDQMIQFWADAQEKNKRVSEAAQRGGGGDSESKTDKYLQQLQREAELLNRRQDNQLSEITLNSKSLKIIEDKVSAQKQFNSELELMEAILPGAKKHWGRGEAGSNDPHGEHSYLGARDLTVLPNQKFYSPAAGRVSVASGGVGGYGNLIRVNYGNGIEFDYGHPNKMNVKAGDVVKAGQELGLTGGREGDPRAGNSRGAGHLHVSARLNGSPVEMKKALAMLKGMDRKDLRPIIDPEAVKVMNEEIESLIKEQEAMKAKFLKGGYVAEAEKAEQKINDLRKKQIKNQEEYSKQIVELQENEADKRKALQDKLLADVEEYAKASTAAILSMQKDQRQFGMTDLEKGTDNMLEDIAKKEKEIQELKTKINSSDIDSGVRSLLTSLMEKETSKLGQMIDLYSVQLARIDDKVSAEKDILEQIAQFRAGIEKEQAKVDEANKNPVMAFILKNTDGSKLKESITSISRFNTAIDRLKASLKDLRKDEAGDREQRGRYMDEKLKAGASEIERRMKKFDSTQEPKYLTNDLGFITGTDLPTENDRQNMRSIITGQIKNTKALLKDMEKLSPEEKKQVGTMEKKKQLIDQIAKMQNYLLQLSEDQSDELYNQVIQYENIKKSLEYTSKIFHAISSMFSSFEGKAANEASKGFSIIASNIDAVTGFFNDMDKNGWVEAAINLGVRVLKGIGDITGLYPNNDEVRKEAHGFANAILEADIEIQKARTEALKLAGKEGTEEYYAALRETEEKEHRKNMAQLEEQMQEQLSQTVGFFDVVAQIFNGPGNFTQETEGKRSLIKTAFQNKMQAETANFENAGKSNAVQEAMDAAKRLSGETQAKLESNQSKANNRGSVIDQIKADLESQVGSAILAANDIKAGATGREYTEEENSRLMALGNQIAGYYQEAEQKRRDHYAELRSMDFDHQEAAADFLKNGLKKRQEIDRIGKDRELDAVDEQLKTLAAKGQGDSQEYSKLLEKKLDIKRAFDKRMIQLEEDYNAEVKALQGQMNTDLAAMTADKFDDIKAQEAQKLLELENWQRQMKRDFPEMSAEIDRTVETRKTGIAAETDATVRQTNFDMRENYRQTLLAEAEATETLYDDLLVQYQNTMAQIADQQEMDLANTLLTDKEKANSARRAAAERLKAEKTYRDAVRDLQIKELNFAKRVREMIYDEETRSRKVKAAALQAEVDTLDIAIRKSQVAIAEIEAKYNQKKLDFKEQDLDKFTSGQTGLDMTTFVREALKFNDVNISGNLNDAAGRKTQTEAVDEYVSFLKQKAETDRTLKLITGGQAAAQMQSAELYSAAFAKSQIEKINTESDAEIAKMIEAGNTAEELDIHRRKRDKEVEAMRKRYADAFDRYREYELKGMDELMAVETQNLDKQLELDKAAKLSKENQLESEKILIDELRIKYQGDMDKIEMAILDAEAAQMKLDSSFNQIKQTLQTGGVSQAIDEITARYRELSNAAQNASNIMSGQVAIGSGSSAGSSFNGALDSSYNTRPIGELLAASGYSGPTATRIKDTGQSSSEMNAQGFYVNENGYWYTTSSSANEYRLKGLAKGAVMPSIPGWGGRDILGPYMLAPGEEVVSGADRKTLLDHFQTSPDRFSRSMSMDQSIHNKQVSVYNTINNKQDADYLLKQLMGMLEDRGWSKGANIRGYVSR